jgi:hypothetical protein
MKFSRNIALLYGLICASYLMASEPGFPESGSVSSTNATYDGNALILTGHVVLDHGLGKMTAEEASLQKQEMGKDFPFSVIELRKDVHLALKNSAELLCETADLDFNALKGLLHAKEDSKVVYTDVYKKKKEMLPFKLTGNSVELLFFKQPSEDKKSTYDIETVLVKDDVLIDYAQLFHLRADHALYRKQNAAAPSASKEFQGIITAYPKDELSPCQLTHGEDVIDADMIDLNMMESKLSLLHPRGRLISTLLPKLQKEPMRFSADHLIWDHITNTLSLRGHIQIQEESLGVLTALEDLQLIHSTGKGKSLLKAIHAQGPTTLTYKDPSFSQPHKLVSHGKMDIDRSKLLATLDSPEKEGRVPIEKQIYYEEEEIGVFADRAVLEYSESEDLLHPVSLNLKGNIRLFSHDPKQPPRCGIADRLNYSLTTRTLILAANPGSRVLFWDESQGLRMSASEVHITHDPETNHHMVKGVGKVQLTLTTEEQQHLKQLFPYYKVAYE